MRTETGLSHANPRMIRSLTYMMFFVFALTTDAVGVIIPEVIRSFSLSLSQAASFHYATMIAIATSGIGLGFLADRYGRKPVIFLGLGGFAAVCMLFLAGRRFEHFVALLFLMGLSVGVFKTAALALIGDISRSTQEHTTTMNLVEGFFGVGAIVGPAVVTWLLGRQVDWPWLYVIAGGIALGIMALASLCPYPPVARGATEQADWLSSLRLLRDPHALGFSIAIALYVAVECAIYVWMPTLLLDYRGPATTLAAYALSVFFAFRAAGRFLGAWILQRLRWQLAIAWFSGAILACYVGSVALGVEAAVWLLPLSGLFMSIMYPTLNSKGISGFAAHQQGSAAGLILFFTAVSAAVGPLLMGLIGDAFGHVSSGFVFATGCAMALFAAACLNLVFDPSRARLQAMDATS